MRYEKSYLDLVTDTGTVCVAYDSRLELFGSVLRLAGVEIYDADGSRRVLRAESTPERSDAGNATELRFQVAGGTFRMEQRSVHGAFVPDGAAARAGLTWHVRAARAEASAELELGGTRRSFRGLGYEDCVRIETPTRALGLSRVEWGRAHLGAESWVWNAVELETGERWSRLCRFVGPNRLESREIGVERSRQSLVVYPSPAAQPLELRRERVLHEGTAFDGVRFPGWFERNLTRLLSGPVLERRSLSRATLGTNAGWAIEEQIRLGKTTESQRPW